MEKIIIYVIVSTFFAIHLFILSFLIPLLFYFILVWSNFEIADMDFWRGPAYTAFFEFLDSKGGFYYEVTFFLFIFYF